MLSSLAARSHCRSSVPFLEVDALGVEPFHEDFEIPEDIFFLIWSFVFMIWTYPESLLFRWWLRKLILLLVKFVCFSQFSLGGEGVI